MKNVVIKSLFLLALVVGFMSCEKEAEMQTKTFNYTLNTGQIATAYGGTHPTTIAASVTLEEIVGGTTKVSVTLTGAKDTTYAVHAHDKADPATTTNGTPYIEAPNANVYVASVTVSGGTGTGTQVSTMSFEELTTSYEGFLVVHDPTQTMSTVDISTYLVLGNFARE